MSDSSYLTTAWGSLPQYCIKYFLCHCHLVTTKLVVIFWAVAMTINYHLLTNHVVSMSLLVTVLLSSSTSSDYQLVLLLIM